MNNERKLKVELLLETKKNPKAKKKLVYKIFDSRDLAIEYINGMDIHSKLINAWILGSSEKLGEYYRSPISIQDLTRDVYLVSKAN